MSDDQGQTQPPQQQDNSRSLNIGGMDFTLAPQPPSAQQGFSIGGVPFLKRGEPPGERFIPSWPRPPSQWGKSDSILDIARERQGVMPGPFMPQASDTKGLIQSILGNKGLGGIGSGGIRALAMSGMRINDRWIKDFLAGRQMAAKLADDEYKRTLEQIELKQQQESEQYGLAFELYNDPKDQDKLKRALYQAAVKFGDQEMIDAVNRGDLTFAHKLNQARDHHLLSLMKVRQQAAAIDATEARTRAANEKEADAQDRKRREDEIFKGLGLKPNEIPQSPGDVTPSAPEAGQPDTGEAPGPAAPQQGAPTTTAPQQPSQQDDEGFDVGPGWMRQGQNQPSAAPGPQQTATPQPPQTAQADTDPENAPPYQVAGPMMPPPSVTSLAAPEGQAVAQAQASAPQIPGQPQRQPMAQIDRLAEDVILGGKGWTKTGDKRIDETVIAAQTNRVTAMRGQLDRIRADPRYDSITDPQQRQQAVISAISQISPRIAQRVGQLVNGSLLLTSRQMDKFEEPIALAGKADPTFNVNNPQARANAVRYYTTGLGGRQMLASMVGHDHLQSLREAAERLRVWQTNSTLWNQGIQFWRQQNPLNSSDPRLIQIRQDINRYLNMVHNVAPEVEFAISGKPATVSGRNEREASWSPSIPVDDLIRQIDDTDHLLRVRLHDNMASFRGAVGGNPAINLERLWTSYEQAGAINDSSFPQLPTGPEYAGNPVLPTLSGRSYTDVMREMERTPTGGGGGSSIIINRQTGQRMRLSPDGTRWEPVQ